MAASDRLTLLIDGLLTAAPSAAALPDPGCDGAGRPVWIHAPDEAAAAAAETVVRRLDQQQGLAAFVTVAGRCGPADTPAALAGFLDRQQPRAVVLLGSALRPATVFAAASRGLPLVAAGLRHPSGHWLEQWWARPLARRMLRHFAALMAEDVASLVALRQAGAPRERLSVGGILAAEVAVQRANDAERESLSELMSSRPVWCAAALLPGELPVLAEAQRLAMQRLHRLLLVIVPDDPADGPTLHQRLTKDGWNVGLRSEGDEPTDDVSIYVADLGGELGLWLRLAPVAFIGGTLTAGGAGRTPMEAAALGSAILHGPETHAHASDHARLDAGGAARLVRNADEIAAAVDTLAAPDQAAVMAHAAWEVSSAGDEAAARLVEALRIAVEASS